MFRYHVTFPNLFFAKDQLIVSVIETTYKISGAPLTLRKEHSPPSSPTSAPPLLPSHIHCRVRHRRRRRYRHHCNCRQ